MSVVDFAKKIAAGMTTACSSIGSIAKCLLMSRKPSSPGDPKGKPLVIMGNGPSLREAIDYQRSALKKADLLAVNFSPNSAEFFDLKPEILVLADPHFFNATESDPNVGRLWKRIAKVDWRLKLYIPVAWKGKAKSLTGGNLSVKIRTFNLTPVEGARSLRHLLYRRGWGMPRPRNVMIPAIMVGIREGYRDIYLVGADHSWSRTLWVDEKNRVISVQPHFYNDNAREKERVEKEYQGYHIHDIYTSLAVAFRSYHIIADFAASSGVSITNATPGSFIDAFPRGTLGDIR